MELPRLMIILDGPSCDDVLEIASEACAAGARFFQWRHKQAGAGELYDTGRRLAMTVASYNGTLLINDRLDVAIALAADGVHLPQAGLPLRAVRATMGPDPIVGVSCHDLDELAATRHGASFVTYGPVYSPLSKEHSGEVVGLDGLREAADASASPIFALGGITPDRVAGCLDAGAYGVAVIGAVCQSDEPYEATARLLAAIASVE